MDNLSSVWMQELTWEDIQEYLHQDDLVIIPVGSTEQHGPAGPLGLDSYVAIALAEDTAKKTNTLVTPPLWFGDSLHHLDFPGTISLSPQTLTSVVKDIIRSLARHGFKKIIIINGHKGTNLAALRIACRTIHQDEHPETLLALVDPLYLSKGIAQIRNFNEHHAGELEISQVWYKYPNLIREGKLTDVEIDWEKHLSSFATKDLFGGGQDTIEIFWNSREQKAFTPTGSMSNNSKASPEKGKCYHDHMVDKLAEFISWLRQYQGSIGNTL